MTTEPKPAETAAAAAEAPAKAPAAAPASKSKAKSGAVAPVFATMRINGTILPGEMFRPDDADARVELVDTLKAARDLSDGELALFEKIESGATDEDPLG